MPLNLDRDERARNNQREERRDKATKANEKDSETATTTQRQRQRQWQRQMNLWTCDTPVSGLAGSFTSLSLSPPHPSSDESMQPVVMATMAANGEGAHKEQSTNI